MMALAACLGIAGCGKDAKPAGTGEEKSEAWKAPDVKSEASKTEETKPAETKSEDTKAGPSKKDAKTEETETPGKVDMSKVSYCIGLSLGRNAKAQDVGLDVKQFLAGLDAGLAGKTPRITDEEIDKVMAAFQQDLMAKQMAKMEKLGEENKKKGADYLAANRKKPGVRVTASGLQYKVLKTGKGKQPKGSDTVTVHYKGTLTDGTEFDSSYKRGEPATFPLSGVIAGWTEALLKMREGDKWQVVIPSELAYKERGRGQTIGPNAVLVFEVELVKVEDVNMK